MCREDCDESKVARLRIEKRSERSRQECVAKAVALEAEICPKLRSRLQTKVGVRRRHQSRGEPFDVNDMVAERESVSQS